MSKKTNHEFREGKQHNRNSEGLRQRRLKEEARWRFNPNDPYPQEETEDDDYWEQDR